MFLGSILQNCFFFEASKVRSFPQSWQINGQKQPLNSPKFPSRHSWVHDFPILRRVSCVRVSLQKGHKTIEIAEFFLLSHSFCRWTSSWSFLAIHGRIHPTHPWRKMKSMFWGEFYLFRRIFLGFLSCQLVHCGKIMIGFQNMPKWLISHQQKLAEWHFSPEIFPSWRNSKIRTPFTRNKPKTGWWFQPLWKICSSKWVHLPQTGMNINKNIWSCHHPENHHPPFFPDPIRSFLRIIYILCTFQVPQLESFLPRQWSPRCTACSGSRSNSGLVHTWIFGGEFSPRCWTCSWWLVTKIIGKQYHMSWISRGKEWMFSSWWFQRTQIVAVTEPPSSHSNAMVTALNSARSLALWAEQ